MQILKIEDIKNIKDIENFLEKNESESESFSYFKLENKYTENACFCKCNEDGCTVIYNRMLQSYLLNLKSLEVYSREEIAEKIWNLVKDCGVVENKV